MSRKVTVHRFGGVFRGVRGGRVLLPQDVLTGSLATVFASPETQAQAEGSDSVVSNNPAGTWMQSASLSI